MKIYAAMGAKAIDKKDKNRLAKIEKLFTDPNIVFQRKLDGERTMVHKDVTPDEIVQIFGRGSSKANERMEKTALLPHVVSAMQWLQSDTVLDAEVLFIPKHYTRKQIENFEFKEDFWKCRSIMGSFPEKAIPQQQEEGWLHLFIFDVLKYDGCDLVAEKVPYGIRHANLLKMADFFPHLFKNHTYIHIVPIVRGEAAKRQFLEDCINLGLEGVVAKRLDGEYAEGKKPTGNWTKIKQEKETDCVIMGYSKPNQFTKITRDGLFVLDNNGQPVEEESKYYKNGWIGAIWVGQYLPKDKVTKEHFSKFRQMDMGPYTACAEEMIDGVLHTLMPVGKISGMDESTRSMVTENMEKLLSAVVKVNYFDQTDDSYFQLRFNCFRPDKNESECVWE